MSQKYPDLAHTQFPERLLTLDNFQDVTASMKTAVDQYYAFWSAGDFTAANNTLASNPVLKSMLIDANKLNQILDSVKALQRLFKDDIQAYIYELVHQRGEYSALELYHKFDFLDYTVNGVTSSYQCMEDGAARGTLPTNSAYFIKRTIQGEKGDPGTGLTNRNAWYQYTSYVTDDMVSHNNTLWACVINNTNSAPSLTNSSWNRIMQFTANMLTFDTAGSSLSSNDVAGAIIELDNKYEHDMYGISINYYTKAATDTLLLAKSDTNHTHTDKANKTITHYMTLGVASWAGYAAPYTQTQSTGNIKAYSTIGYDIANNNSTTVTQMEAWLDAMIIISAQSTGAVIFKALGSRPLVDIPIVLHIAE